MCEHHHHILPHPLIRLQASRSWRPAPLATATASRRCGACCRSCGRCGSCCCWASRSWWWRQHQVSLGSCTGHMHGPVHPGHCLGLHLCYASLHLCYPSPCPLPPSPLLQVPAPRQSRRCWPCWPPSPTPWITGPTSQSTMPPLCGWRRGRRPQRPTACPCCWGSQTSTFSRWESAACYLLLCDAHVQQVKACTGCLEQVNQPAAER